MTEELEDWEGLVKAPGFLRLQAFATAEFAQQMDGHLEAAAGQTDDLLALQRLRQVIAAKRAVERVMTYPKERISTLRGQAQKDTVLQGYTRGGL